MPDRPVQANMKKPMGAKHAPMHATTVPKWSLQIVSKEETTGMAAQPPRRMASDESCS